MKFFKLLFEALASYKLALFLLIDLFLLTWLGTLEQREQSLFTVQKLYYESWWVLSEPEFFGMGFHVPVPLLGGVAAMGLLTLNLIAGGIVRMRKTKATLGVLVIHVGIILMMCAALVKMTLSDEGHLTLYEGQQSDEYVSYYLWEIAVFPADQTENVRELVIQNDEFTDLRDGKEAVFRSPDLPFELRLAHFVPNCVVQPKGPMWNTPYPVIDGYAIRELPLEKDKEHDVAGVYATVEIPGREPQEGILWGLERYPLVVETPQGPWAISMRHSRYQLPFTVRLEDFHRELHPRTGIPKVFLSDITQIQGTEQRELRIEMNEPLRDEGYVLFQASWGPSNARPGDPLFSTFAVHRNPSDYWPLYSLLVVMLGLAIAFVRKLWLYVRAQIAKRHAELPQAVPNAQTERIAG